ncbi:TrbG/VirB9 family P-type conjugative transfer protein [Massilia aerilata]|uniref:TrbG/VirB9 family P-type conjugative transfer protein n=1 Tax=Massilia aerilata TaxID=453817 RepID=A0ABW0RZQ8_9BURK
MKLNKIAAFVALMIPVLAIAAPAHKTVAVAVTEDVSAQPIPAPKENRIVRYTYSPDVIFRILALPNLTTHLELGEDEGVKETPAIGDQAQWIVTGGPRNLFIKPLRFDLETSLTIVTNKRTYQFQLIAGRSTSAQVFQKVSFFYPDREMEVKLRKETEVAAVEAEQNRLSAQVVTTNVDPASLDFGFKIEGEAPFKPTTAYSNGKFTFLIMPNTQDSPAIFLLDGDNKPSLINYQVKGNMIVVERVATKLLLKLGNTEVRITKRSAFEPKWGQ